MYVPRMTTIRAENNPLPLTMSPNLHPRNGTEIPRYVSRHRDNPKRFIAEKIRRFLKRAEGHPRAWQRFRSFRHPFRIRIKVAPIPGR
jgi:hypothetical protein